MDHVYRIDSRLVKSGKWWNNNFKYPCPVDSHSHELYQCGMTPKEQHDKLKGRICRTCLKPGGLCLTKDNRCSTRVPKGLTCDGCVQYTQGRKLPPHSILYCTSSRPEHVCPAPPPSLSSTRLCRNTLVGKLPVRLLQTRSAMECSCVFVFLEQRSFSDQSL